MPFLWNKLTNRLLALVRFRRRRTHSLYPTGNIGDAEGAITWSGYTLNFVTHKGLWGQIVPSGNIWMRRGAQAGAYGEFSRAGGMPAAGGRRGARSSDHPNPSRDRREVRWGSLASYMEYGPFESLLFCAFECLFP